MIHRNSLIEDAKQEAALYRLLHPDLPPRRSRYLLTKLLEAEHVNRMRYSVRPPRVTPLSAPEAAAHFCDLYPEYRDEVQAMQ